MRLNTFIQKHTHLSRRAADQAIEKGQVTVNNTIVYQPFARISGDDVVTYQNQTLKPASFFSAYYAFYKPRGVTCSHKRFSKDEAIVSDYYPSDSSLFPVGRLDRDSEGLLILTNDGKLAEKCMHPRYHIEKEYIAHVDKAMSLDDVKMILQGYCENKQVIKPVSVHIVHNNVLKVILTDGKKHEVRKLCKIANLNVQTLIRVRIGGLLLGELKPGKLLQYPEKEMHQLLFGTK